MNKLITAIKRGWDAFENALFPEFKCMICGREAEDNFSLICNHCKQNLILETGHLCERCGNPIPEGNQICDECKTTPMFFDKARAAYIFDENSAKMIYGLKYSNKRFIAKHIAPLLIAPMAGFGHIDCIIPVPLHKHRYQQRGYNQSELIANALSSLTTIPTDTTSLIRHIETEPQTGKGREERQANLVGAFRVTNAADIRGKNILLVDDVYTTGTTLNECARMLKRAGAAHVFALTVLKTLSAHSHIKTPKHRRTQK